MGAIMQQAYKRCQERTIEVLQALPLVPILFRRRRQPLAADSHQPIQLQNINLVCTCRAKDTSFFRAL